MISAPEAVMWLCRHRNAVVDTKVEASLGVSITGPGPAHAELADSCDGTTEVLCTARTAGAYVLSVFDLASGASLFGSPYKVIPCPEYAVIAQLQRVLGLCMPE